MPNRDRHTTAIVSAGVVLILLAAYVGAYYWTVRFAFSIGLPGSQPKAIVFYEWNRQTPSLDLSPSIWNSVFAPMEWIDRRIRPGVWNPPLDEFTI